MILYVYITKSNIYIILVCIYTCVYYIYAFLNTLIFLLSLHATCLLMIYRLTTSYLITSYGALF